MGMKIAIIGAGSSYTPEIVDGLLDVRAFMPLEVALYDLPEGRERAQTVCSLAGRMARKRGADAAFHVAESLSEAVVGCRFVVSQFRVGLLEAAAPGPAGTGDNGRGGLLQGDADHSRRAGGSA